MTELHGQFPVLPHVTAELKLQVNNPAFTWNDYIGIREDPIRFKFIIRLPRQGIPALSRLTFLYLVRFEDS